MEGKGNMMRWLSPIDLLQAVRFKFGFDRKRSLIKYIRANEPKSILEIGVFNGIFASKMLKAASINDNKIRYVGVDLFLNLQTTQNYHDEVSLWPDTHEKVLAKLKFENPNCEIQLCVGDSRQILKSFQHKFDLIFIDGGHSENTVRTDFENSVKLLNSQGTIFLDDYTNFLGVKFGKFGIRNFVKSIDRNIFEVKIYKNRDFFTKPYGILSSRLVKVKIRKLT